MNLNKIFFSVSEEHSVLLPRRLLVFLNPMAGSQNGKVLFEKYVKKMFDLAEIQYVVEITGIFISSKEVIENLFVMPGNPFSTEVGYRRLQNVCKTESLWPFTTK